MSDQLTSKAGTITSGEDRFMEWKLQRSSPRKTKDGNLEFKAFADFTTFFEGIFQKERLLQNNLSRFRFLHTVKQTLYKQIK